MAIHWQVKFKSLRADTLYTVNLYDSNYSGSPVQLTGAASPFVTQEEDSEDMFQAIRKQSGYIRIIDNGITWRQIIPTTDVDRPVTLTHMDGVSEVIDWQGFMQAQNFGAPLYEVPCEREFPVQCPLSVIDREDMSTTNHEIKNFAFLLLEIIDAIPSTCRPQQIVVQGGYHAKDWLTKKIDWKVFMEEDKNHLVKAKYDLGKAFEDMCKFWGLTARTRGTSLYLVCPDDRAETKAFVLSYAGLQSLAAEYDVGSVTDMFTTISVGNIFANNDNNDYQDRGPNKSVVTVDTEKASDVLTLFDADLITDMNRAAWAEGTTEHDGDTYWHYTKDITSIDRYDLTAHCSVGWASFNILFKRVDIGGTDGIGYSEVGNVIHFKETAPGGYIISMATKFEHCFDNGFIRLFGDTYRKGEKYENGDFYAGNPEMKMRLGIGKTRETAQWWNGRAWQPTICTFQATIGNKKPEIFSRYWIGTLQADTISIINTTGLYGKIFVDFYGSDDARLPNINNQKSFDIKDFRIEFSKNDNVTKQLVSAAAGWYLVKQNLDIPDLVYESHNNNMVKEDYSVDCIYGSNDAISPSYGILLNHNVTWMDTAQYGTGNERPEQHLADRIVNYWSSSKRKIQCNLLTNDGTSQTAFGSVSPRNKVTIDGTTMYPVSISNEWREDICQLILMQV